MATSKNLSKADKVKLFKKEHGDVWTIEVEDKVCFLKTPNRSTYETALGLITPIGGSAPKMVTAGTRILQACWIDGDKEILAQDALLVPAAMQALALIEIKQAVLKKN